MFFKTPKAAPVDRGRAETIAAEGLAFLAEDSGKLDYFLTETGIDVDRLRSSAGSPEVLQAVLEHINANEPLLLVFADSRQIKPETIALALAVLQGPTDWS
jgi:Protein of unknown function (DUF3572)